MDVCCFKNGMQQSNQSIGNGRKANYSVKFSYDDYVNNSVTVNVCFVNPLKVA